MSSPTILGHRGQWCYSLPPLPRILTEQPSEFVKIGNDNLAGFLERNGNGTDHTRQCSGLCSPTKHTATKGISSLHRCSSVGCLRADCASYQVFEQKAPHPRGPAAHFIHPVPPVRNVQSAGRPRAAVPVFIVRCHWAAAIWIWPR